ncbi:hypothetical protein ACQX3S_11830 [Corynebacterium diphtheriae]
MAAMHPQVLLLDEPSSNLDLAAVDELRRIVAQWKTQGRTVLIAEHRLSYLVDIVDRVLVMQDGQIAHDLSGSEFRTLDKAELYRMGLRSAQQVPEVTASHALQVARWCSKSYSSPTPRLQSHP